MLALLIWTSLARLVRGEFLSLREKEFVEAARAMGASSSRIIFRHMLPNAIGTIIVSATLIIAVAILLEAALSYLGFGVQPPDTSLGRLISEYQNAFSTRPWLFWWPGLFIIVIALSVNFIGDGLRDAYRPQADQGARLMSNEILKVEDLAVAFPTDDGLVTAVRGVSYSLHEREVLAIVGESGSGKSVSAMALMGLLPKTAQITGSIRYRDEEVLDMSPKRARSLRGQNIAMVFQDPMTAMNPVYTVGDQLAEAYRSHHRVERKVALAKAAEMLDRVGIPQAKDRVRSYPHEFSGGMRQRAMIAMAIINNPDIIIADEPTTALDVTVQAQILETLIEVKDSVECGCHLDHARPRRGGRHGAPGVGHVRGSRRSSGPRSKRSTPNRACLTPLGYSARSRRWTVRAGACTPSRVRHRR